MSAEQVKNPLEVTSEIGKLQVILLHRPGKELEMLTPKNRNQLLFDDIPWLKKMKAEHNDFVEMLKKMGTTVYYVEDLLAQVLETDEVKASFIQDTLFSEQIFSPELSETLHSYLMGKKANELVETVIAGLNKRDLSGDKRQPTLADYIYKERTQYINALPNLYFMRDPASVIGTGISINSMWTQARRREPMIIKYIFQYHPLFGIDKSHLWYDHTMPYSIEGGDILVLSKEVLAIGCSERTSPYAIEMIAKNLFSGYEELKEILVIHIPEVREYMHLDTVFTMVDRDKFTIYPGIQKNVQVYKLARKGRSDYHLSVEGELIKALKKSLKLAAVNVIQTGGEDDVIQAREQWNDGTNTLALAPGVVATYSRNEVSNEALRKNGVEVVEIEGSELVRGRGGPRCMSMPLVRDRI